MQTPLLLPTRPAQRRRARVRQAEVDAEKVSAVRSAIQQGTYVVNPEAIADKLLSNAQEMLRRTTN
jgi:negative regulator of flagellin synthesis FlgM